MRVLSFNFDTLRREANSLEGGHCAPLARGTEVGCYGLEGNPYMVRVPFACKDGLSGLGSYSDEKD